jgi:hypothetical protein
MRFQLVSDDQGAENIIVFVDGDILEASTGHPNFNVIKQAVLADDSEALPYLFDTERFVNSKFESLSERVKVSGGEVYFDGDKVNSVLTDQILRFLEEDVEDWRPLVAFYENLAQNPNEHSREQLFNWLQRTGEFTITSDGHFLAYKGVAKRDNGSGMEEFVSVNSGRAIRNDEEVNGQIINHPGDVITMPRSDVQFNPSVGCSTGLHAGTWDYAYDFAQGAVLLVKINPRDVVSVPTDCAEQKLRVCRYEVVEVAEEKNDSLVFGEDFGDDYYGDYGDNYDELDEDECDCPECSYPF